MSFKLPYYSSLHIIIIVEDKIMMNNMKITNLQTHTFLLGSGFVFPLGSGFVFPFVSGFVFPFESGLVFQLGSGFVFPLGSGLGLVPL